MRLEARTAGIDLFLIALSLAGAFLVDQWVVPHDQFVSAPFAVAVLIAAYRLPSRGAMVTAVLAAGLAVNAAYQDASPFVPTVFHLLGLFLVSALAILLGHERRVSAEHARNAQNLFEQANSARTTLDTVIDTLPAGVMVSDTHGTITLANPTANAIFGGQVTGNAYGPSGGYTLLDREGTPFPAPELPLPRAIERGEESANVEVRVRREDGTERVILAGGRPIRDEHGRVTGAVAVFQDVTERIQTEEALRASQESLTRAQEVAHLGSWDMDLRVGQVLLSDEVYRIMGVPPEAFVPTLDAYLQRVHPDDREGVAQAIQEMLGEGRSFRIDHRIVRPDGTTRFVHAEAQALHYADGQVVRAVGTIQDITERKLAEEEHERLLQEVQIERARVEAILNNTASAIIYVETASGAVQANPAAVQLFGHPIVIEPGPTLYLPQLRHPDERPVTPGERQRWRALLGQTTVQEEFLVVQPDGTRVPVLASSAAVRSVDGQVVSAVMVFQDISALKEIERLREEWTSIIAHDLRQPISVIMGYAGMLEMEVPASTEQYREVAHIIASARNLSKMIDDLLDVSRIEARRLALQQELLDLPTLVTSVVERAKVMTVGHQVHLDVDGAIASVLADPGRLEQVLGNLLSNAVKYSDPEGAITVTVQRRDDVVVVSVANRGPGIPPSEISQLFSRFYRTPKARTSPTAGLGLGLYISKGIVEAHQGQIWVESAPGQTTTFAFTLPLARGGEYRENSSAKLSYATRTPSSALAMGEITDRREEEIREGRQEKGWYGE